LRKHASQNAAGVKILQAHAAIFIPLVLTEKNITMLAKDFHFSTNARIRSAAST